MKKMITLGAALLVVAVTVFAGSAISSDEKKAEEAKAMPSADEQVAKLEAMCAANVDERMARHKETPLFHRLGGEEKIHALLKEVVRLHEENPTVAYLVEDVDNDDLARRVISRHVNR